MTGYASTLARVPGQTPGQAPGDTDETAALSVEIRSVNGRFLDLGFKLPEELRSAEPALREMLAAALKRGKVELRILTRSAQPAWASPHPRALTELAWLQAQVQAQMPQARALSVQEVLQWCSRGQTTSAVTDEAALRAARQCVQALLESREREGEKLVTILQDRAQRLRALAAQAEPLVPAVVEKQQARFLQRWQEALASTEGAAGGIPTQALQERALQEAATYAIRIDVAEELSRLVAHLDEIERLLAQGGELGKRLDFLIQELHREANTLGSKSAALELTGISVEMKVLIEQMREQVQNIE
jgi:uncharacterized protein (TIGR00255 family)